MLGHKPRETRPTLEVHNVVLPFLFRQAPRRDLTGQGHRDVERAEKEPHLLASWVLSVSVCVCVCVCVCVRV